jgi:nucleoside-diphosphate-sugar epimerase
VLVTGATGPFGRAVSHRLVDEGHDVVAMARRKPAHIESGVTFVQGDIRAADKVRTAMQGCSAVVHLAYALAPLRTEAETIEVNLGGTENVLEAMAATGCNRLVYSSSVLAYGAVPGHPPLLKEDDERRPEAEHYYAAHKKVAEDMITDSSVDSVLVRAGMIVGRDVDNTLFRVFNQPALPLPDPDRTLQLMHTQDAARFTADAVSSDKTGPVNVVGDGTVTMREFAQIMGQPLFTVSERAIRLGIEAAWKLGASEVTPGEMGGLLYMPAVDTTRMREEWGFTCAWSTRAAAVDMARAAHGLITLGKKTIRLPWRFPLGSAPTVNKLSAALLRHTYAGEVNAVVRDIADVEAQAADETNQFTSAANRELLADLADHAAALATLGDQHSFDHNAVNHAAVARDLARSRTQS